MNEVRKLPSINDNTANPLPRCVCGYISPYPTVVIVTMVSHKELATYSNWKEFPSSGINPISKFLMANAM